MLPDSVSPKRPAACALSLNTYEVVAYIGTARASVWRIRLFLTCVYLYGFKFIVAHFCDPFIHFIYRFIGLRTAERPAQSDTEPGAPAAVHSTESEVETDQFREEIVHIFPTFLVGLYDYITQRTLCQLLSEKNAKKFAVFSLKITVKSRPV